MIAKTARTSEPPDITGLGKPAAHPIMRRWAGRLSWTKRIDLTQYPVAIMVAATILLIGFALRTNRVGAANVWWDEAYSVWLARKPILEGIRATSRDVHPPLFYVLLHGWMGVVGDSEFSARYLSVLAGTSTLAILYLPAARLLGRRYALFAMLLLALSRFHIWWSQEIRMYAWAALLISAALYFLIRALDFHRGPAAWLLYAVTLTASFYTLYLSAMVLPALALTFLILLGSRRISRRTLTSWVLATALSVALMIPWLMYFEPSQPGQSAGETSASMIIALFLTLISTGNSTELGRYAIAAFGYGALMLAALSALAVRRQWFRLAFLLPLPLVPPLLALLLANAPPAIYTPALEARYYLLFAPLVTLLPAAAVRELSRFRPAAAWLTALALILLSLWSLPAHYSGRYLRDQWKSAVRIIDAYAEPEDVVLMVSGDRYPLFLYEYQRLEDRPPLRLVPDGVPMVTANTVDSQLRAATAGARRIWLVEIEANIQDQDGLTRAWLERTLKPSLMTEFDYNRLTLFTTDGLLPPISDRSTFSYAAAVGDRILAVELPVTEYRPGDTVHLGIYSDSMEDPELSVTHESGLLMAEPQLSARSEFGVSRRELLFKVTQATPKGTYVVRNDRESVAAFLVAGSDPLWRERDIDNALNAELGEVIELVGFEIDPKNPAPGDSVVVDLFWRLRAPTATSYTVFVQLVGPMNPGTGTPLWGQHDGPPVADTFFTNEWPIGLIIRDRHSFDIDSSAPASNYSLLVGMYDPADGQRLGIPGNAADAVTALHLALP